MSKTSLTHQDVDYIRWANRIRRTHRPVRRRLRRVCADCGRPWGHHGCPKHLWAVDFLSQFSVILVPGRPDRPRRRHGRAYVAALREATDLITRAHRPAPRPTCPPVRRSRFRGPVSVRRHSVRTRTVSLKASRNDPGEFTRDRHRRSDPSRPTPVTV